MGHDQEVAAMIADYLKRVGGQALSVQVERAFKKIKAYRQKVCPHDAVTVAAEHDLFTRCQTSSGSWSGTACS